VYQGDNPKASANFKLGEVVIDKLTPEPKGAHKFQVTFALDADGVFDGEILHEQTNESTKIKLDRGAGEITERKRLSMAELVETGVMKVEAASGGGASGDPIDQFVADATDKLSALPANQQRELSEKLRQLHEARANHNTRQQAMLVAEMTMMLAPR
jgi:molecular chaperone DnaK (HSP70)